MIKSKISFISIVMLLLLVSCKGNNTKSDCNYSDGKYDAEINYYNPKTGTQSTYTLKVEIENDKLVKIYWSNGGWLDESHFTPPDISTGKASFTSDKGYMYLVRVLDNGSFKSRRNTYPKEENDEEEESDENECPECGYYKYTYDDYCDDCQKLYDEDISDSRLRLN